jgi:hypothetical protein
LCFFIARRRRQALADNVHNEKKVHGNPCYWFGMWFAMQQAVTVVNKKSATQHVYENPSPTNR